jgi:hypothetical protein
MHDRPVRTAFKYSTETTGCKGYETGAEKNLQPLTVWIIIRTMKYTDLYQQLKEVAARLDITVSDQNLRATGVNAKSGLCRVKGKQVFIMDKHLPIREKAETLADCLRAFPIEDVYLMPAIRAFIDSHAE